MAGASSTLVESGERMQPEARQALARSVFDQSRELSERVSKVLQMTRLDAGAIKVERDWTSIADDRRLGGSPAARPPGRPPADRRHPGRPASRSRRRGTGRAGAGQPARERGEAHAAGYHRQAAGARPDGQKLVLSVEDHGGDAADVDLERMFGKFQHGSMEGTAGGVGLGLAICRAIVRLHGGDSWAERTPGGGMTFRISLPLEHLPECRPKCRRNRRGRGPRANTGACSAKVPQ